MARGRFLSATIRDDKRLNSVSLEAEYLFLKTIPHLDRDGLISADTLWADACPRRKELLPHVDNLIAELAAVGLVVPYECDEGRVLWFPGFPKNQAMTHYEREAPSRFPHPSGFIADAPLPPEKPSPDKVRIKSGQNPPRAGAGTRAEVEVKVEVKGEVEEEVKATTTAAAAANDPVFCMWNENIGTLTPHLVTQLQTLQATYSDREIVHAIGIAVEANKPDLRYVRGILKRGVFSDTPAAPSTRTGPTSFAQQSVNAVNAVFDHMETNHDEPTHDPAQTVRQLPAYTRHPGNSNGLPGAVAARPHA